MKLKSIEKKIKKATDTYFVQAQVSAELAGIVNRYRKDRGLKWGQLLTILFENLIEVENPPRSLGKKGLQRSSRPTI